MIDSLRKSLAKFRRLPVCFIMPWLAVVALLLTACETGPGAPVVGTGTVQPGTPGAAAGQGGPTQLMGVAGGQPYLAPDAGSQQGGAGQPAIRVAILLPLTGSFADLGTAMLDAAQLAVFEMAGSEFELMVFDTGGDPDRASEAARRGVDRGASLIIGPLLSTSTRSAAQWARAAGVPLLSFSSDRTVAGNGVFVLGFTPGDQVRRVIQYAKGRGIDRYALLAPDDAYGTVVVRALRETADAIGGQVGEIQLTDRRSPDYSRAVDAAMASLSTSPGGPVPALMIAEGGTRLREAAAVLPAKGLQPGQPQLLGTGTWDEAWVGSQPALVGGWFAAPPPGARSRFVQSYSQAYGATPPRLAGLAYDATALAAVLGRSLGGARFTADMLTTPSGFLGSEGIFRLRSTGVAERGLAVLEVKPWGLDVVSEAPQSFAGI